MAARPVSPATPGHPTERPVSPATPGHPTERPVSPATPGHRTERPVSPGHRTERPVSPGHRTERPVSPATPGHPTERPVSPATPGHPTERPVSPATPGHPTERPVSPGHRTERPVSPGHRTERPVSPATPGHPTERPVSPATPGHPTERPVSPATPGHPTERPVSPGYPTAGPVSPGYPTAGPVSPGAERFGRRKEQRLRAGTDPSRRGRWDQAIAELLHLVNGSERYCSTSSCSGRVLLLGGSDYTEVQKQNCSWLYVTHQKCRKEDVVAGLQKAHDNAVFKFEPFVLHVQCRKVEDAQLLHSVAINSGFRNSGITIGKKGKIMMAVRSTHCLEVPLCHRGTVLVSEEYIDYLVHVANQKMEENQRRIERFYTGLQSAISATVPPEQPDEKAERATSVYTRRRRQRTTEREWGNAEPTADSDGESDLVFLMGTT